MLCNYQQRIATLVVEEPEVFEEDFWLEHFGRCKPCRDEWQAYSESLAVFRQLERERVSHCPAALGWEKFSELLRQERRRHLWDGFKLPVAAAVSGLLAVGSMAGWLVLKAPGSFPAGGAATTAEAAKPEVAPTPVAARPDFETPRTVIQTARGASRLAGGIEFKSDGRGRQIYLRNVVVNRSGVVPGTRFDAPENQRPEIPLSPPANLTPVTNRTFPVTFPLK